jgi:two-component system response regulator HydG
MVDLPKQLQDFSALRRKGELLAANVAGEGLRDELANPIKVVVPIADMEKQAILGTIRQLDGDKLMAARLLGIGKTTLYRKLKEYGLT